MKPRIHRSHTLFSPDNPGQSLLIDQYFAEARETMSADELRELAEKTDEIQAKMTTEQAQQHFDLHQFAPFLIRLLQSERVAQARDPLPDDLAEAGIAARYLLKEVDVIPDSLPEIGLTDDARVVARFFERHPDLLTDDAA